MIGSFVWIICLFAIQAQTEEIRPRFDTDERIMRGADFIRGEFPWIVALLKRSDDPEKIDKLFCGGTLVSENVVLTAAHCIKPKQGRPYTQIFSAQINAIFGAHNLDDSTESERQSHQPNVIHVHPDWNPNNARYDADIAALDFNSGKILLSSFVKPIAIWDSPQLNNSGLSGFVAGWGKGENPDRSYEPIPKNLLAPFYDSVECLIEAPALVTLFAKNTFCAGLQNGTGVCFGDSGNGYFVKVSEEYYLKGLVSASLTDTTGGCQVKTFAIYTDILKFSDWVNQKIQNAGIKISMKKLCEQPQLYCEVFDCTGSSIRGSDLEPYEALSIEYPFAAALRYKDEEGIGRYICNGVLISELYVVAAAHCVEKAKPYLVTFGKTALQDKNNEGVNVEIRRFIIHPDYNDLGVSGNKSNNIALVELLEPVSFSPMVQAACLAQIDDGSNDEFLNIGYGRAYINGKETGGEINRLLKVSQNRYANDACGAFLAKYMTLESSQICTKGQPLLCIGSSGSFLGRINGKVPVLYGLMSMGFGCSPRSIRVSIRITSVANWIEGIVWPDPQGN